MNVTVRSWTYVICLWILVAGKSAHCDPKDDAYTRWNYTRLSAGARIALPIAENDAVPAMAPLISFDKTRTTATPAWNKRNNATSFSGSAIDNIHNREIILEWADSNPAGDVVPFRELRTVIELNQGRTWRGDGLYADYVKDSLGFPYIRHRTLCGPYLGYGAQIAAGMKATGENANGIGWVDGGVQAGVFCSGDRLTAIGLVKAGPTYLPAEKRVGGDAGIAGTLAIGEDFFLNGEMTGRLLPGREKPFNTANVSVSWRIPALSERVYFEVAGETQLAGYSSDTATFSGKIEYRLSDPGR